jgi:hypothetical protein
VPWLGQEQRWKREMTTLLKRREDLQMTLDDARKIPGFFPENSDFFKGKSWKKPWKNHGKSAGKPKHHVSLASSCLLKRLEDWTIINHYNFATNSNPFTN